MAFVLVAQNLGRYRCSCGRVGVRAVIHVYDNGCQHCKPAPRQGVWRSRVDRVFTRRQG